MPRAGELTSPSPHPTPRFTREGVKTFFPPLQKVNDTCNFKLPAVGTGLEPCALCLRFTFFFFFSVLEFHAKLSDQVTSDWSRGGAGRRDTNPEKSIKYRLGELHVL